MSLIKTLVGRISDTEERVARIDASTHSLQVLDYEHHEIHGGNHFIISDVIDLAINNVFDMQFVTPDSTKWTHFTFALTAENETEWYVYEDAAINVTGTTVTPINNNRNSGNASVNAVYTIQNTSIANANADTSITGSFALENGIIGSGRTSGGTDEREKEFILKQDSIYCFRAIANTAGWINFVASWYEHTDKD